MEHPRACRKEKVLQAPLLLLNMQTEKLQANVAHGNSQEQQTQVIAVNGALGGRARRERGPHAKIHTQFSCAQQNVH